MAMRRANLLPTLCGTISLMLLLATSLASTQQEDPKPRRLQQQQQPPSPELQPGVTVHYLPAEGYKGQEGQDKWINERVFRNKPNGVFVDLGCYDGITYSNTWYFEKMLNWTGICVEPNPEVYPRISHQAGRRSGVQLAVSDREVRAQA